MEGKREMKRIYRSILCIVLCTAMLLAALPVNIFAETKKEYISEIRMVSIDDDDPEDREKAQKILTDAGYKITYQNWGNLNAGADDGCCYIGYKTTTDRSQAITDLRVMDMNGGYVKSSYDGVNSATRQGIDRMKSGTKAAMKETRENYNNGSPAAKYAVENLNRFTVDGIDNMPMGDAILSDKISDGLLEDILTCASGRTLALIFSNLLIGCTDYNADGTTWIDRLKDIPFDKKYPNEMFTDAEFFVDSIESTGKKVAKATEFFNSLYDVRYEMKYREIYQDEFNAEYSHLSLQDRTDPQKIEEIKEIASESARETVYYSKDELIEAVYNDLYTLANADPETEADDETKQKQSYAAETLFYWDVNNIFNQFEVTICEYGADENGELIAEPIPCALGDSLWGWTDAIRFEPEWCYPVFEALTKGQRAMIPFCGIENFISGTLENTDAFYNKLLEDTASKAASNGFTEEQLNGTLSVFWDYNSDFTKDTVFLTDKAARSVAAQYDEAILTAFEDGPKRMIYEALQWCTIASGVLGVFDVGISIYSFFANVTLGFSVMCSAISSGAALSFSVVFAGIVGILGSAVFILTLCIYAASFIINLIHKYSKPDYTDMPEILYDVRNIKGERKERFIRYDLVKAPNGDEADMNAFRSDKWLALYYTKDASAGNPILADLLRTEGNGATPDGWSPLRLFGSRYAVNTNLHADEDSRDGLFLFFRRDGGDDTWEEKGAYLRTVKVVHGTDESVLKHQIELSEENEYYNVNLTPSNGYTYITFSTTDEPNEAVKDIRVVVGIDVDNGSGGYRIGDITYANAGYVAGLSFLITKNKEAGDPIFADSLHVIRDHRDRPQNYIPVCHASGGPAVNLDWERVYKTYERDFESVDLYFQSDRQPDDTDDVVYLSGIAEILAEEDILREDITVGDAVGYAEILGYTVIEGTDRWKYNVVDILQDSMNVASCYGYTTTTYYKRALQDVMIVDKQVNQSPMIYTRDSAYVCIPSPMLRFESEYLITVTHTCLPDYPYITGGAADWVGEALTKLGGPMVYVTPATSKDNAITFDSFVVTEKKPFPQSQLSTGSYNEKTMYLYDDSTCTYASEVLNKDAAGKIDDAFYIIYKGSRKFDGKYLAGVCVDEFHEKRGTNAGAYVGMIGQGADSFVGNFTMRDGNWPYGDDHYFNIGLKRTDDERKALTDIKIICYPHGESAKEELLFANNIRYTLASKECVCYMDDDRGTWTAAYVYVTNNPDAGSKIKNFYFTDDPKMDGSEYVEFERCSQTSIGETLRSWPQWHQDMCFVMNPELKEYPDNDYDVSYDILDSLDNPPYYYFYVEREAPNKYISDVGIVYYTFGNADADDYEDIVSGGVTKYYTNVIDKDLNSEAGGRYMNIVYKRTTDPSNAITDLKCLIVDDADDASEYYTDNRGITYRKVHNGQCPDLNKGAGGYYIYLYSTKDSRAGDPVTDINVLVTPKRNHGNSGGYKCVTEFNEWWCADFNEDAGGDYVWVEFRTEAVDKSGNVFASFFSDLSPASYIIVVMASLAVIGVFTYGVIRRKRSIRKKKEETA